MGGLTDLAALLASLRPELRGEYVFVRLDGRYGDGAELQPFAAMVEDEGLTLVVPRERARAAGCEAEPVFARITLRVHSSLEAVGLTAVVAEALRDRGISANVIAAYHHDHVFVPVERAGEAVAVLEALGAG